MSTTRPSHHVPARADDAPQIPQLARNLARQRERRGLGVAALAAAAGLEEEGLAAIEHGARAPTIEELWALAGALGVPYARLIRGDDARAPESLGDETRENPRASGVFPAQRRVLLRDEGRGRQRQEISEITLPPHGTHTAQPSRDGARESIMVTRGRAVVDVGSAELAVDAGQEVSVAANVPRVYRNVSAEPATLYVLLSAPLA
jgi:transcriptional regulator with XRE-family HTH domain